MSRGPFKGGHRSRHEAVLGGATFSRARAPTPGIEGAHENALAETVNGYYKAELIRGPARSGPWKTVEEVELATLGWVHRHNHQRIHRSLGDLSPAEFEAEHYAHKQDDQIVA